MLPEDEREAGEGRRDRNGVKTGRDPTDVALRGDNVIYVLKVSSLT